LLLIEREHSFTFNMEGHIYVRGDIGQDFSRDVEKQLQSPDVKNASDLVVHISSRGVSVYEGYTVYHLLKATGKPITS
ncbi:ATP-dependent Clp protease proteolytic subunit, partial [Escherichia coli]|uniref:ATP-dependent Clp protease proteolytic subunit n=1 Tax=Escherichia coli TaxID=562 RepID=UPI0021DFCC72